MQRRMLTLVLGAACSLTSCFAARTDIDFPLAPEKFTTLEIGSTAREVLERLGAPTQVVQLGTRSAYLYQHTIQKRAGLSLLVVTMFNDDTQNDRVWLFFDESDRLSHVGSTFQAENAEFELPFQK